MKFIVAGNFTLNVIVYLSKEVLRFSMQARQLVRAVEEKRVS